MPLERSYMIRKQPTGPLKELVAKARAAFGRSRSFHGFELHRSIEKPQRYRLMVKWETLENHTVDFRGSENFAEWRGLVGQYFAAPPDVEHTETVLTSAG